MEDSLVKVKNCSKKYKSYPKKKKVLRECTTKRRIK